MLAFRTISSRVSVTGALTVDDVAEAAAAGYRTIVNVRPDGESANQASSETARRAAESLGLKYVYIPAAKHELFTDAVVDPAQTAFRESEGPILAHCAGGQRAAIVWAAAEARNQKPVADVLADLKAAGFDFAFLRDDLDAQADRARWSTPASAAATLEAPTPDAAAADESRCKVAA